MRAISLNLYESEELSLPMLTKALYSVPDYGPELKTCGFVFQDELPYKLKIYDSSLDDDIDKITASPHLYALVHHDVKRYHNIESGYDGAMNKFRLYFDILDEIKDFLLALLSTYKYFSDGTMFKYSEYILYEDYILSL